MALQSCPLCDDRRARRACPALGRSICATCCGTKRLVEIRCPSDCPYLSTARNHPPAAVQRRQERDARFLVPLMYDLTAGQSRLFFSLQALVLSLAGSVTPSLIDHDIADAAGALASTYETASRGIIYEHKPASLPAQRLVHELTPALKQATEEMPGARLKEQDLLVVMRRLERAAREAQGSLDGGGYAYLGLLHRIMGDPAAAQAAASGSAPRASGSGLVIP